MIRGRIKSKVYVSLDDRSVCYYEIQGKKEQVGVAGVSSSTSEQTSYPVFLAGSALNGYLTDDLCSDAFCIRLRLRSIRIRSSCESTCCFPDDFRQHDIGPAQEIRLVSSFHCAL